jgi:hypothetical protein
MYMTLLRFSSDLNKTELIIYMTVPHFISVLKETKSFVNMVKAISVVTHAIISDPSGYK